MLALAPAIRARCASEETVHPRFCVSSEAAARRLATSGAPPATAARRCGQHGHVLGQCGADFPFRAGDPALVRIGPEVEGHHEVRAPSAAGSQLVDMQ
jgi:hypothetical protein